jgi:Na+-driven multidrug efflux pump
MGLSMAVSTVVGQNVGAGHDQRAVDGARIGLLVGFWGLNAAGLLLFLFAEATVRAFVPTDTEVIALGARFMYLLTPAFGFFGLQMVMSGALAGAGNTMAAMMLSILSFWVLRFPVAWVLSVPAGMGPDGVFWSFPISNVLSGGLAWWWFMRGGWIKRVVNEETALVEAVREEAIVEEGVGEG